MPCRVEDWGYSGCSVKKSAVADCNIFCNVFVVVVIGGGDGGGGGKMFQITMYGFWVQLQPRQRRRRENIISRNTILQRKRPKGIKTPFLQ